MPEKSFFQNPFFLFSFTFSGYACPIRQTVQCRIYARGRFFSSRPERYSVRGREIFHFFAIFRRKNLTLPSAGIILGNTMNGAVAQLARAIRSHRIGHGFDSHQLHHFAKHKPLVTRELSVVFLCCLPPAPSCHKRQKQAPRRRNYGKITENF